MRTLRLNPTIIYGMEKIRIGYEGENVVSRIEFDISKWISDFGAGGLTLLVQRHNDLDAYPVPLVVTNGIGTWTITQTDCAYEGAGAIQLVYVANEQVKKSQIYTVICDKSLDNSGNAPDPYESWLETLTELTAQSTANAQSAQKSAQLASDKADEITGLTATAQTLPAGSSASASYSDGVLTLGIPQGNTGEQGIQGEPALTIAISSDTILVPCERKTGKSSSLTYGYGSITVMTRRGSERIPCEISIADSGRYALPDWMTPTIVNGTSSLDGEIGLYWDDTGYVVPDAKWIEVNVWTTYGTQTLYIRILPLWDGSGYIDSAYFILISSTTQTQNVYRVDHTFEETYEAYQSGKIPLLFVNGAFVWMSNAGENRFIFLSTSSVRNNIYRFEKTNVDTIERTIDQFTYVKSINGETGDVNITASNLGVYTKTEIDNMIGDIETLLQGI